MCTLELCFNIIQQNLGCNSLSKSDQLFNKIYNPKQQAWEEVDVNHNVSEVQFWITGTHVGLLQFTFSRDPRHPEYQQTFMGTFAEAKALFANFARNEIHGRLLGNVSYI